MSKQKQLTLPHFKHPIIKELYFSDFSIDRQILKEIIKFGKDATVDLELLLADIIKNDEKYAQQEDFNWHTPTHALHLLGELKAEESLPMILKVFSQSGDFLEFWFNDALNDEMWEVLYKCGQNSLDAIETFLKDQSVWIFARTAVSHGLQQIYFHHPNKQAVIVALYKRVIEATIPHVKYKNKSRGDIFLNMNTKDDDAKDIIAFYVCDLIDFHDANLEPYLRDLFRQGVVEETVVDEKSINFDSRLSEIKEIKSIFDRYDELELIENRISEPEWIPNPPLRVEKIGRNEPCPCESGKKYKKCCYLKQFHSINR